MFVLHPLSLRMKSLTSFRSSRDFFRSSQAGQFPSPSSCWGVALHATVGRSNDQAQTSVTSIFCGRRQALPSCRHCSSNLSEEGVVELDLPASDLLWKATGSSTRVSGLTSTSMPYPGPRGAELDARIVPRGLPRGALSVQQSSTTKSRRL